MTQETIQIHIGKGTTIDGGPFANAEIVELMHDGVPLVSDETHMETPAKPVFIEESLTNELESNEPIHISSIPADNAIGYIELPLVDGHDITVFGGDAPVHIIPAEAIREGNITGYDYDDIQQWIDEDGASYSSA